VAAAAAKGASPLPADTAAEGFHSPANPSPSGATPAEPSTSGASPAGPSRTAPSMTSPSANLPGPIGKHEVLNAPPDKRMLAAPGSYESEREGDEGEDQ
jgi:hypothetical protein